MPDLKCWALGMQKEKPHGLEENPSKTGDEPRAAQGRAGADHDERTPGGGQGSSAVSENYGKLGSNDLI